MILDFRFQKKKKKKLFIKENYVIKKIYIFKNTASLINDIHLKGKAMTYLTYL